MKSPGEPEVDGEFCLRYAHTQDAAPPGLKKIHSREMETLPVHSTRATILPPAERPNLPMNTWSPGLETARCVGEKHPGRQTKITTRPLLARKGRPVQLENLFSFPLYINDHGHRDRS